MQVLRTRKERPACPALAIQKVIVGAPFGPLQLQMLMEQEPDFKPWALGLGKAWCDLQSIQHGAEPEGRFLAMVSHTAGQRVPCQGY